MLPIVILTAPNSGSSLLAWIFEDHGFDLGHCQKRGCRGGENRKIKDWLLKRFGSLHLIGQEAFWDPEILEIWDVDCLKTFVPFYKAMPPCRIVKARRDLDGTIKSSLAKRTYGDRNAAALVRWQNDLLDHIPGHDVDMDQVVSGNYATLEGAFDYLGLRFRPEIVNKLVEPKLFGGTNGYPHGQ